MFHYSNVKFCIIIILIKIAQKDYWLKTHNPRDLKLSLRNKSFLRRDVHATKIGCSTTRDFDEVGVMMSWTLDFDQSGGTHLSNNQVTVYLKGHLD